MLRSLRVEYSKQVTPLTGVPASLILKDEAPVGSYRIRHKARDPTCGFFLKFLNTSRSPVSDGNSSRWSCSA